jgi:hypothetical protein
MTYVRAKGRAPYAPWPAMRHAAASLRNTARKHPVGSNHTISAALVMTAFSVEAFIQTIGPEVLPDTWDVGEKPVERWRVLDKLKAIGKATGVAVDFGVPPWSGIKELFQARDRLAHAKPDHREFELMLTIPDGADEREVLAAALEEQFQPLHNLDRLDALAQEIDQELLTIWTAAGHDEFSFTWHGMNSWSLTAI